MSDDGNFCCRPTTIFKRTRSVYISSPVGYFILIFFLLKVKAWWTTNTETGPVARTGAQFETKCVEICFDGTLLPKQYDLIIYFSFRGAIWLSLPLQTNLSCGIQSRETEDYFYLLQIIVQRFFFALFLLLCRFQCQYQKMDTWNGQRHCGGGIGGGLQSGRCNWPQLTWTMSFWDR